MTIDPAYDDLLGKPFQYHGTGPDSYDCKGLAAEVYRRLGIAFPSYESCEEASVQHALFLEKLDRHALRLPAPEPFCMAMFMVRPPWVSHLGVVLADRNRFIHVMRGVCVCIERLDSLLWERRVAGFYRLTP